MRYRAIKPAPTGKIRVIEAIDVIGFFGASIASALLGSTAPTSAGDWINPNGSSSSTSWFDSSSSRSSAATQQLAPNHALANSLANISVNKAQGKNLLAGHAALNRVVAAVKTKLANPTGNSSSGSGGGFSNVQNLMSSLDNISINHGSAIPTNITSSGAASGYATVQNLMSNFDNITINTPHAVTGGTSLLNGGNPLAAVDTVIAIPKFNVQV